MEGKMSQFTPTAVGAKLISWIIFPLCLASICLSVPAAAEITHVVAGGSHCKGKKLQEGPNNTVGCYTTLHVGPGTGSGGGFNPKDRGLCGLWGLSGTFDNNSIAKIVVQDGYYTLETFGSNPKQIPEAWMTCVLLSDLTTVEPSKTTNWSVFETPTMTSTGAPETKRINNPAPQYACIWAGVVGGLSTVPAGQGSGNFVYTQQSGPEAVVFAQSSSPESTVATYAFCSEFKTDPWSWTYYPYHNVESNPAMGTNPFPPFGPVSEKQYWCYMVGIAVQHEGPISAVLSLTSSDDYTENTSVGTGSFWNCLPLAK
jgi:hypothetical protein